MTIKELKKKLDLTGYPVAYYSFSKAPTIPFIAFVCDNENVYGADDSNDVVNRSFRIELYTNKKDLIAEQKVEEVLNFTHFEKNEVKIDEESLYQIIYEFDTFEKK